MEDDLLSISSPSSSRKEKLPSLSSSSASSAIFAPLERDHDYDEEKKGNYLKYLLNSHYYVNETMLLGKIYQVAPWKTGRYIWKSKRTLPIFPFKLFSHIFLILLLSCLLLFLNNQYGAYHRGMAMISCGFFLPKEQCNYNECVGYLTNQANSLDDYTCSLYKKGDILAAIDNAIDQYYRINETSIGLFQIPICDSESVTNDDGGDDACASAYGLTDCQPTNYLTGASIKFYRYNSENDYSYSLLNIYHSGATLSQLITKQNISELRLIELHLPILDSFITDNYRAIYHWNIVIKYEFETKVKFDLSVAEKIQSICNIDASSKTFFAVQSSAASSKTNNIVSEFIALSSLQGWMNILSVIIIIISFIYFLILLYETVQNIRLVCFTADVMSFNPFLQSASSSPSIILDQMSNVNSQASANSPSGRTSINLARTSSFSSSRSVKYQTHRVTPQTWKEKILDIISIVLRYILRIPSRFYLNDFPELYSIIATHIDLLEIDPLELERIEQDKKEQAERDSESTLIGDYHYGTVEKRESFQEMKEFYELTREIFRLAPDDLYNIPKSDRLSNQYAPEQQLLQERKKKHGHPVQSEHAPLNIPQNQPFTAKSKTSMSDMTGEGRRSEPSHTSEIKFDELSPKQSEKGEENSERILPGETEMNQAQSEDSYSEAERERAKHEREELLKFEQARDLARKSLSVWKKLSVKVKMRLLDGWRVISFFTTIITIYVLATFLTVPKGYYLLTSIDGKAYHSGKERHQNHNNSSFGYDLIPLLLGLATFLQYFTLLNYLRYNNRFTTSTIILWSAFFKVQRIIVSILPLAFGLMLLGIVVFGNSSESFGSIPSIFITVYSVMNCDSIWDTFNDTNSPENSSLIGTIYVTVIFIIFSYLMLRLILAVVESLYFYFRLYSNLRRKRLLYRKKNLVDLKSSSRKSISSRGVSESKGSSKVPSLKVRTHNSDLITKSLFTIYTNDYQKQKEKPPST